MTLSFITKASRKKPVRRPHSNQLVDPVEAVRRHLDNVELGSPLLYPY